MRPAECLTGLVLEGDWKVTRQITPPSHATGGCFSVGYLVQDSSGKQAYLKALDFSKAFQAPDFARELQSMTTAYNFERDLLSKCMARKLHRIVTPIADGTVKVSGNFGPLENVCYLIFEKAKGNIRDEVVQFAEFDLAWCLRSLHNSAVGLQQLHSIGIAHQDIKPSNILVFTDNGSKISDLGCASELSVLSPRDGFPIPGDTGYAPPELFYNINTQRSFSERCIADIFLLGSLFFFYFAKCSATQAIHSKIKGFKGVNFTNNDFINDLPYIRQAFQEAIIDLESQIRPFAGTLTPSIIQLVSELCEPDPQRRGDPLKIGTSMSQHDLERFISAINLLAMKAEFNLK